jgi:hypothetical protein
VLKSVRWLLTPVAVLAMLVGVGLGIYFAVTKSGFLPIAVVTAQGIAAVVLARRLGREVLRTRAPSPAVLADWLDDSAALVAWVTTVLANVGEQEGWLHGPFEYTVLGILGLFLLGAPVYWWRGKRHVVRLLTARAVAGQWPWAA